MSGGAAGGGMAGGGLVGGGAAAGTSTGASTSQSTSHSSTSNVYFDVTVNNGTIIYPRDENLAKNAFTTQVHLQQSSSNSTMT